MLSKEILIIENKIKKHDNFLNEFGLYLLYNKLVIKYLIGRDLQISHKYFETKKIIIYITIFYLIYIK